MGRNPAQAAQNAYGAGKTTVVRILATLTRPYAGTAIARGRAGALLEQFGLADAGDPGAARDGRPA